MTYKLDLKDKRILYELDRNARISYSQLAKKVMLNQNSVIYRIEQLKKKEIIKEFRTIVNVGKLGYITSNLFVNLQNTTPEKEKEIIDFLKEQEVVNWIVSVEGNYNIGFSMITKNVLEIDYVWKHLMHNYINYIDKRRFTIMNKTVYFSKAYLMDDKINDFEIMTYSDPEEVKLDDLDLKILDILANNCRTKIIDIAKSIKVTPKTVISRIKNLEEKQVIVGYKTSMNIEKLGYHYYKVSFMLHNLTHEKIIAFIRYSKNNPNITFYLRDIGGEDFEIEVQVKSIEELKEIIDDIRIKFSDIIREYSMMLFYREHKHYHFPIKNNT